MNYFYIKQHTNTGDIMLNQLKKDTNLASDIIYKDLDILGNKITLIYSEAITSSDTISKVILNNISYMIEEKLIDTKNLFLYLYNNLPGANRSLIKSYKDLVTKILNGYTIIYINDQEIFAIETRISLDRGITNSSNEIAIRGPKDSFCENYNKNLGLIRYRIKNKDLWVKDLIIGKYSNTKIGILYINSIVSKELVDHIFNKLSTIKTDGILDSSYLKKYLTKKNSIFPTIMSTERPDVVSQALLEGKLVILVDNSPYALIMPCFFIDFFHTPDDYYDKAINISFIRIIRLLAFIIAIFIPAYYIAITTHNHDSVTTDLLLNFLAQRKTVPYPALVEALLMTVAFEILRESDMHSSTGGAAVSILGGLVLGNAAVAAGIISPIMIIVVAISAIAGLSFTSIELTNAIRLYRIILMILASTLGLYGIFLGGLLLITKLASINSFNMPYLAPFSPLIISEQKDAILKLNTKNKIKTRNPLLSKNKIRGR